MQRQLMDELIAWKSRANRKPLLLKGARQTGKTWLLNDSQASSIKTSSVLTLCSFNRAHVRCSTEALTPNASSPR